MMARHPTLLAAACVALVSWLTLPAPAAEEERVAKWTELPNWSGVWWAENVGILDPQSATPGDADGSGPNDRINPPYTDEYEAKYQAVLDRRKQDLPHDPAPYCMPVGMPRLLTQPFGVEFIVTPEVTFIIWEFDAQVRRIYTDGRDHPAPEITFPTWTGHSIGHWEGDTLVVDTVNIREPQTIEGAYDQTIDRTGGILSGEVNIKERIRKTGPDTIENQVTIIDPVALTEPWEITRVFKRAPDGEFVSDYIYCTSPIISGKTQFGLPTDTDEYLEWLLTGPYAPR